jgi:hypothetical protein
MTPLERSIRALKLGLLALCISLVSLFIVIWNVANAEDITLTWQNPTETFTMAPAGPYENPAGTRIYMEVANVESPTADSYVIPDMKPGTYRFVAVSYDTEGVASPTSAEAEKTVTSFVAAAGSTAYQVVSISGGFWLLPVGTVDAETACNLDQQVNGKYAVPIDAVTMTNPSSQPLVVVADCG